MKAGSNNHAVTSCLFGETLPAGLDQYDDLFWTRALHALGHDHVILSGLCRIYVSYMHSCFLYMGGLRVLLQETCTKTWDSRVLDVVDNYSRRGIVYKIANCAEADFAKCSRVAY